MKKIILILCLAISLSACPFPSPVVGGAVVDCLGANRPKIDAIITELKTIFTQGHVQWSLVYQRAKTAGKDVGGCVIAELVQYYVGGFGGEIDDGWQGKDYLEQFRKEEAGGAYFQSTCKKTDGTTEICKL